MSEFEEKLKSILDSPDGMEKILKTAQSLFSAPAEESEQNQLPALGKEENPLQNIDPKMVTSVMNMVNQYRNTDDRRISLLHALRSYFGEEDQVHITKAIQIVKLSKVAKYAFRSIKEEDSFV